MTRQETWAVSVRTSKGLSKVQGGDPEGTEDESRFTHEGKGKHKERGDEETLQEWSKQQDV